MVPRHDALTCILNGAAGSNRCREAADRVGELFARHDVQARVVCADGREVTAFARKAVAEGCTIVVAAGGDGTMNGVASALVGTDVALGVLPLGTFNHFAKDLKIPLEIEAAVANVINGRAVGVDVGEVNGLIFLNNSSLGMYPWLVRQRDELQRKGYGKWEAFARALWLLPQHYPKLYLRLSINELHERKRETPFAFIGNNKYQIAGMRIGERTRLNGGQLWICRAPRTGHFKLLMLALRAFAGLEPRELDTLEAQEIWIETASKRTAVATDGEVNFLTSPLHYLSRPRALKVIVPVPVEASAAT